MNETLAALGWSPHFDAALKAYRGEGSVAARISAEHRGGYVLAWAEGEIKASLSGRLRRAVAQRQEPHPAVGDWVVIEPRRNDGFALVHGLLPRRTTLARKVAGRVHDIQVIAANVDVVLCIAALGPDLNLRRIERYLTLARESGALPVVVLSKADTCADIDAAIAEVATVARDAAVLAVSSVTGFGVDALAAYLEPGRTLALVGSSGVGKSSLVNAWLGGKRQTTRDVRVDGKGRHTTTHRALFALPGGGLLLDTPGMREIALWDADEGVAETFDDLEQLATRCRFRDCAHEAEPSCAIEAALKSGAVPAARVESFRKLRRELAEQKRRR